MRRAISSLLMPWAFHAFSDLPRQDPFNGLGGDFFVSAVFLEEVLKGRTNVFLAFLAHRSISFFRFIARSRSLSGVWRTAASIGTPQTFSRDLRAVFTRVGMVRYR
jgi:hypothetical protein